MIDGVLHSLDGRGGGGNGAKRATLHLLRNNRTDRAEDIVGEGGAFFCTIRIYLFRFFLLKQQKSFYSPTSTE